jgi:hypothetical protein
MMEDFRRKANWKSYAQELILDANAVVQQKAYYIFSMQRYDMHPKWFIL